MENEKNEPVRQRGWKPKIGSKRTKEQQQYDIAFCSELFLKGYTYRDIADKLNAHNKTRGLDYTISHANIFRDMKQALIEWKKLRLSNIDDYVHAELAKLDKMEAELWEAWEKSKTGKQRKKSRNSKKPNKLDAEVNEPDYYGYSEEATETSAGDPRFMDILLNIQQRRAKLLGFDAPAKVDITGIEREREEKPKYNIDSIPKEMLFALADQLQNAEAERLRATKGLPN